MDLSENIDIQMTGMDGIGIGFKNGGNFLSSAEPMLNHYLDTQKRGPQRASDASGDRVLRWSFENRFWKSAGTADSTSNVVQRLILPSDWSHSVTNPNLRFCTPGRFKGHFKNPRKAAYLWRLFGDSCIMLYPIPLILGRVAS